MFHQTLLFNMTTFIKILQHHHKFLLENHQKIIDCPFYKDTHVDLLFHDKKFKLTQPNISDILHIWRNVEGYINNSKVFILSIRESSKKLSGTGINIATGGIEVGELTLDRSIDYFFKEYNVVRDFSQYYVPLPTLIVELQTGSTEYLQNIDKLTNTFYERLHLEATLERYDLGNKVKLVQTHDTFYLVINSRLPLSDILFYICEVHLKNKNVLRDHIRITFRQRGYTDEIFPGRFSISKLFYHPTELLKDETFKEIVSAAQTFEKILKDFMTGK